MKIKALLISLHLAVAVAQAQPLYVIADSVQKTGTTQGLSYTGVTLAEGSLKTVTLTRAPYTPPVSNFVLNSSTGSAITVDMVPVSAPYNSELTFDLTQTPEWIDPSMAGTTFSCGALRLRWNGLTATGAVGKTFTYTHTERLNGTDVSLIRFDLKVTRLVSGRPEVQVTANSLITSLSVNGTPFKAFPEELGWFSPVLAGWTQTLVSASTSYTMSEAGVDLYTSRQNLQLPGDAIAFEKVSESADGVANLNGNSLTAGESEGWVKVRAVVTRSTGEIIASDPVHIIFEKPTEVPAVAAADAATPIGIPFTFPIDCPTGVTANVYPGTLTKPNGGLVLSGNETYTLFFNYDGNRLFFLKDGEVARLDTSKTRRMGLDLPINDYASITVEPGKRFETYYWVDFYYVDKEGNGHHTWSGPHKLAISDPTKQ